MCYPSRSKPFSKFSQSQPSPGKTEQNKSKEKAWIRLSGMSLFNGLRRPFGKKSSLAALPPSAFASPAAIQPATRPSYHDF
jgi:hypothetical protein